MKNVWKGIKKGLTCIKNAIFSAANFVKAQVNKFFLKHPYLNRIRTLTSMQFRNSKRLLKAYNTKDRVLFAFLRVASFIVLIFVFRIVLGLLDSYVFGAVLSILSMNHVAFILLAFIVLSVLEMSSSFVNTLYKSKDNMILLSMPVKASEVFASKLLVRYIREVKKMAYFIVPMFLGYYFLKSFTYSLTFTYVLRLALMFILIPLFIVLISGLISIAFVGLDYLFKRVPFLKSLLTVGLIVGGFILVINLVGKLPTNLPIKELWYEIVKNISDFIDITIEKFTIFTQCVRNFLFKDSWLSFAIIFGIIAVLLVLCIFVCFRVFFKLSSSATEISSSKTYKSNMKQQKNIFLVFLKKEIKSYLRSDDQVLNTFMYLVILPLLLFALNKIFNALDISKTGSVLIVCINILISIVLLTASNVSSASAISREGSEFYLLKISPADTKVICLAKMTVNIILSTLSIVGVGIALGNVEYVTPQAAIFICIILFFVNIGHICWSLELDILNPKIDQYKAGEEVVNDNSNVSTSVILGLVLAFLFTILAYFFFTHYPYEGQEMETWIRLLLIAIAFCVIKGAMFINRLNVYFDDISL